MAKKIHDQQNERKKKLLLLVSIVSNFGLLFYFKYLNFFIENANLVLLPIFNKEIGLSKEILPIGLSFHTFQSVSYIVDVYKRKIKPETHLGIYSTYVLFFPQMVAGPIERFSTLGAELKKTAKFSGHLLVKGLPLILTGFFYKMVIADNCGEYVNHTYTNIDSQNSYNVLIAVFLFSIQIYSDFFGYSLIAQGSARLFGIQLIDNFAFPFFSENIVSFWRKWHMSLTNWFRDYVYIPLGGNKKSHLRHYINILIVFALSGLWHGAGFNFIVWGLLHAVAYLAVTLFFIKHPIKIPVALKYLFTFALVSFIFVFFRNGKLSDSTIILSKIVSGNTHLLFKPISVFLLMNIGFVFVLELFARKYGNYTSFLENKNEFKKVLLYCYLFFGILTFSGIDNLPFIYFQF
ncbi:MAG: MBOAT family protein [Bacteroidetes bacterium]|nr:MBOAT family protein [Bacteroidota bacterium]